MIRPLRKRHLQVWSVMLLVLPLGIVFSWLVIPNQAPIRLLETPSADLLPVIVHTADQAGYRINIRTNKENSEWQLEWKNAAVLTVPSAVIYKVSRGNDDITKGNLVGRIESGSDYVFQLPPDSAGYKNAAFVLYDFIHQEIIDHINL